MVKEMEEEDEDGLEYVTDTPSRGSYTTLPSTGGCSSPSPVLSHLPTPGDSDPENNTALRTEELEACIKVFLEEVEEDLEMNNLPPLKNALPLLVLAPVGPGFVPFAVSTSQRCVPPKNLLRKVYHPYKDPVGRCRCEPGGWCDDLPCSGRKQCVSRKIRGRSSSHEGVGWGDLAVVLARNLAITRGLRAVDALLLMLHVQEVWNFEWWEHSAAAEEVPVQDWVEEEPQQDCFGMLVAQ